MILSFLIDIILFLITTITNLITSFMPQFEFSNQLNEFTESILEFCSQGINFCNFLFGDIIFVIAPVATILLLIKYTVLPLVIIFRSTFIKGNE